MKYGSWRGNKTYHVNGKSYYKDTNQLVEKNPHRECGHCNLTNREDGHDACLGELQGAMNACCGHGESDKSYVQFFNGKIVRGFNKIEISD